MICDSWMYLRCRDNPKLSGLVTEGGVFTAPAYSDIATKKHTRVEILFDVVESICRLNGTEE